MSSNSRSFGGQERWIRRVKSNLMEIILLYLHDILRGVLLKRFMKSVVINAGCISSNSIFI